MVVIVCLFVCFQLLAMQDRYLLSKADGVDDFVWIGVVEEVTR